MGCRNGIYEGTKGCRNSVGLMGSVLSSSLSVDSAAALLSENNEFLVVGVIGTQGSGMEVDLWDFVR